MIAPADLDPSQDAGGAHCKLSQKDYFKVDNRFLAEEGEGLG
jgi:hypothetical protein